jgi:hypothetical protein
VLLVPRKLYIIYLKIVKNFCIEIKNKSGTMSSYKGGSAIASENAAKRPYKEEKMEVIRRMECGPITEDLAAHLCQKKQVQEEQKPVLQTIQTHDLQEILPGIDRDPCSAKSMALMILMIFKCVYHLKMTHKMRSKHTATY